MLFSDFADALYNGIGKESNFFAGREPSGAHTYRAARQRSQRAVSQGGTMQPGPNGNIKTMIKLCSQQRRINTGSGKREYRTTITTGRKDRRSSLREYLSAPVPPD